MNATELRLKEIEKEIAELKAKELELSSVWRAEKDIITKIQEIKSKIEEAKSKAESLERSGDLDKVAELRYGVIHNLQKELEATNLELNEKQDQSRMLDEEVDEQDIAEIVAKWTGIPVTKMLESERSKLLTMEDKLHERVIGQQEAVISVSNAIRRSRAGLQDTNRPIGSFIFLGTTGVGKTEMAKSLAEFLFDDDSAMIRIDMSEYSEKFAVSRLVGAPPGYVGYEEGGQLTEPVRKRPYAVILLDEIEKAHPEVFNILLQLLDDGRLTDSKGRTVNFTNTIIIMTSNLGTDIIQNKMSQLTDENRTNILSEVKVQIMGMLKRTLRPEFLNRIDETILFNPLNSKEIYKIAELQLDSLQKKTVKQNIDLIFDESAVDWISKIGFDIQFGARPLKRAIQKHIIDRLSLEILSQNVIGGDKIKVFANDSGNFEFRKLNVH